MPSPMVEGQAGLGQLAFHVEQTKEQKRMGAVEDKFSHFLLLAGTQPAVSHP